MFPEGWMCSIHASFTFTVLDLVMGLLLRLHNLLAVLCIFTTKYLPSHWGITLTQGWTYGCIRTHRHAPSCSNLYLYLRLTRISLYTCSGTHFYTPAHTHIVSQHSGLGVQIKDYGQHWDYTVLSCPSSITGQTHLWPYHLHWWCHAHKEKREDFMSLIFIP